MHWVKVDGVELPVRIGGHPALDFCNTWAGWGEPWSPRREYLRDYDGLAVFLGYLGLVDGATVQRLRRSARRRPDDARHTLAAVCSLRANLHDAVLDPSAGRALSHVSTQAQRAAAASTLRAGDDGRMRWELRRGLGLDLAVLVLARAGADLLTSDDVSVVKACPGDDCGWLFVDRRGRRRWCSMNSCGNRAKVRAHAERHRAH